MLFRGLCRIVPMLLCGDMRCVNVVTFGFSYLVVVFRLALRPSPMLGSALNGLYLNIFFAGFWLRDGRRAIAVFGNGFTCEHSRRKRTRRDRDFGGRTSRFLK